MSNPFYEMVKHNTASKYFKEMSKLASHLDKHYQINHFWYYKIYLTGNYSCIGTNEAWNEFSTQDKPLAKLFSCLRHPECLNRGVNLMRATKDKDYQKLLDIAWKKFKINFNINLVTTALDGIEAFGFATRYNDPDAEDRLLKHLPMLLKITKEFKKDNEGMSQFLNQNLVYLPDQLEQKFYERPKTLNIPLDKDETLPITGFKVILSLTTTEKNTLAMLARGYSPDFLAGKLKVSPETAAKYLLLLQNKLSCDSIDTLYFKARYFEKSNFFQF